MILIGLLLFAAATVIELRHQHEWYKRTFSFLFLVFELIYSGGQGVLRPQKSGNTIHNHLKRSFLVYCYGGARCQRDHL